MLPRFSAPASTRRAAGHVTPSRRLPPLCPASAASTNHIIHCPPHRVCPLHSPQGQCPRRAHFNHRPHRLPLPMSTPSVDVDLRARPDLPRCNDSSRPFRPPRRPTTRHRTHFDSCGAQILAESAATPAALWGGALCASRVSQADCGLRCMAHHTVFMNKDAACKAASVTQRRIGWLSLEHLHRYLQVYLQGNL
jgi:hypothetical protein